jgi:uncharacterized protein YndB with AHSA1/START domain
MDLEILQATPASEITASRIVNAPIEIVFKAWTDPEHLKNWWGPAGFTNTINTYDLKPGGKWSFIMHGPDKGNYPNEVIFVKIDAPNLIVWNHISKPEFQVVASFESLEFDKTTVSFKLVFDNQETCDKVRAYAPDKNEENLDRLEEELRKMM